MAFDGIRPAFDPLPHSRPTFTLHSAFPTVFLGVYVSVISSGKPVLIASPRHTEQSNFAFL